MSLPALVAGQGAPLAQKRKCPLCAASVNLENLEVHLAKVHPRDRVRVALSEEERRGIRRSRRPDMTRSGRKLLTTVLAGGALAALALFWAASLPPAPGPGGTIHFEPSSYDFGPIGQDVVSTTFRIHNRGETRLLLQGVSTSCMCTTARVVYAGRTSPTFGYHDNPAGWSLELPPGAEASLEVFYDPTVHPELGHYVREVYVLSSDPAQREASVQIHVTEV